MNAEKLERLPDFVRKRRVLLRHQQPSQRAICGAPCQEKARNTRV